MSKLEVSARRVGVSQVIVLLAVGLLWRCAGAAVAPLNNTAAATGASGKASNSEDSRQSAGVNLVSYQEVKGILAANCLEGCHSKAGGVLPEFTSEAAATKFAEHIGQSIDSGVMPPKNSDLTLDGSDRNLVAQWAAGASAASNRKAFQASISPQVQQPAMDSGSSPANTAQNNTDASSNVGDPVAPAPNPSEATLQTNSNVVAFHIRQGTGRGAWNDAAQPITLKVGQKLQVYNDDSVMHWIHTNGTPFFHPFSGIAPGQSATYNAQSAYNGGPLHDHLTYGSIFMKVQ